MSSINSLHFANSPLEKALHGFLDQHYDPNHPILLALSGGPDSLALFYLLIHYRQSKPLHFAIAHVDHRWREQSAEEALQLQNLAQQFHVPFFLTVLNPDLLQGNLEAASRQERLRFFRHLCQTQGYQAVLMAHHADDQAETVLKRLFEGAHLSYLGGLKPITRLDDLVIWRPLLTLSKKSIGQWLEKQGFRGFEDSTNLEPKFLRGRFRTSLMPYLSQQFGKEITPALEKLGREACELQSYWEEKLKKYIDRIVRGSWGLFLDLSQDCPFYRLELSYLVRKILEQGNARLSRQGIETATQLILSNRANCQVEMGNFTLYIDRQRLFLPLQHIAIPREKVVISQKEQYLGPWKVNIQPVAGYLQVVNQGWKEAWKGRCEAWLPAGEYHIGPVALRAPYPGRTSINQWWTNTKVPAFMRHSVPVVWQDQRIIHEFLSGRQKAYPKANSYVKIELELIRFQDVGLLF
jgi:tRNA(Ile)-lysidine synthase